MPATYLVVRHHVQDYAAWRKVFDDFADVQDKAGVTAKMVYQSASDPNAIMVMHRFDSDDKAQAFVELAELKEAMMSAGVEGAPEMDFYHEAG